MEEEKQPLEQPSSASVTDRYTPQAPSDKELHESQKHKKVESIHALAARGELKIKCDSKAWKFAPRKGSKLVCCLV